MKKIILIIGLVIICSSTVFAQEQRLTQEEFACETVEIMKIEYLLPVAALASDCVDVLEDLGISPLKGWRRKEFLSREDYFVLVGKAQGKEGLVHKRAYDVEIKNIEFIDKKWQVKSFGYEILLRQRINFFKIRMGYHLLNGLISGFRINVHI